MSTGGRLVKKEVDCAEDVDKVLLHAESLAAQGNMLQAAEEIAGVEKKCRIGCDAASEARLLRGFVKLCVGGESLDILNDYMVLFSKRRSQLKLVGRTHQ